MNEEPTTRTPRLPRKLQPWIWAIAGCLGTALVAQPLARTGTVPAFPLFVVTVALAASLCGPGPGLAATGVSLLALHFWLQPPAGWEPAAFFAEAGVLLFLAAALGSWTRARDRVVQNLRDQERRFRLMIEHSAGLLCVHELDGKLILVNPAAAESLGYEASQAPGLNLRDFIAPEFQHLFDDYLDRIRRTGSDSGLMRVVRKDGAQRLWMYRCVRWDEAGKPSCVIGDSLDVTELYDARKRLEEARRDLEARVAERTAGLERANQELRVQVEERLRAEAALRESEERYRTLIEQGREAIFVESAGKLIFANPACARLLGAGSAADLHGRPVLDFIHPGSRPLIEPWLSQPGPEVVLGPVELKLVRLDGSVVDAELAASRLPFEGRPAIQATVREIGDRKRAEDALRASEERYRELFENASALVYTHDEAGILTSWNRTAERSLGWSRRDVLGTSLLRWVAPEHQALVREKMQSVIQGRGPASYELEFLAKDGRRLPVEVSVRLLQPGNTSLGVQNMATDVSERRKAQKALQEQVRLSGLAADVRSALTQSAEFREGLQKCAESAVRALGASTVQVWTYNPLADLLELEAAAGFGGPPGRPRTVPLQSFDIGPLIRDLKPYVVSDLRHQRVASDAPWAPQEGMRGFAGCPLVIQDRLAGVVVVHAEEPLSDNAVQAVISLASAISFGIERKWAEERLRRSEAQYRWMFESNPNPLWVFDVTTLAFLAVNDAAIRHYGYSRDEFLAMTIEYVLLPEEVPRLMAYVTRGTGELEQTGFWKHRKKDGAIIDVEVTAHPIHFLGRSAMLVLAHDVTARRRAEAEVRRLASIVESTGDAIISMTIEGEIVSWNAAAERLYGFSAGEVKGNHLSLLAAPGHADEIPYLLRRVRNGERLNNWETRWTSRDGSILDVSVTYSPIRDAEGVVIGASTISRDMTERRRAEQALYQMSGRLLQVQEEERRRIARGLHDAAAQLLTALQMNLSLAEQEPGSRVARKALAESTRLAEQCTAELRRFSYLLHPLLLDELGLLAAVRAYIQEFSRETGIRVSLETGLVPDRLPRDAEIALFRVVQEALANIQAHSGSPTAVVSIASDERHISLDVADHGRGIPQQTLDLAIQGASSPGLGIAGMRERIRQLGGWLDIVSSPAGTTVKAVLPWPRSQEGPSADSPAAALAVPADGAPD